MKKYFSKGLYIEGLKQLRMVGIIGLVIFVLEAVLGPVGNIIRLANVYEASLFVSAIDAHWILVLSFIVFAPVMVMILFGFLNKRNMSDFY